MANMQWRSVFAVIMGILGIGVVFAIAGANPSFQSESRWGAASAGSDVTEGGNVTVVNLQVNDSTEKWAAYWGNVSGALVLTDTGNGNTSQTVYNWSFTAGDAGDVCLSTNSAYNFASFDAATTGDINTAWAFSAGDADDAVDTFNETGCTVNLATDSASSAVRAPTGPAFPADDYFFTCAVKSPSGTTVAAGEETKLAFCSLLNGTNGKNYFNRSADYEIIVPTTVSSTASETYFFYVELG